MFYSFTYKLYLTNASNSFGTSVITFTWMQFKIYIHDTKYQSVLSSITMVFQGTYGCTAHISLKLNSQEERYYDFGVFVHIFSHTNHSLDV